MTFLSRPFLSLEICAHGSPLVGPDEIRTASGGGACQIGFSQVPVGWTTSVYIFQVTGGLQPLSGLCSCTYRTDVGATVFDGACHSACLSSDCASWHSGLCTLNPIWSFHSCCEFAESVHKSRIGCSGPATFHNLLWTSRSLSGFFDSGFDSVCLSRFHGFVHLLAWISSFHWAFGDLDNSFLTHVCLHGCALRVQKSRIGCSGPATSFECPNPFVRRCAISCQVSPDHMPADVFPAQPRLPAVPRDRDFKPFVGGYGLWRTGSACRFFRDRVHKSRIGCSGSATIPALYSFVCDCFAWALVCVPAFFLQLILVGMLALLRTLLLQLGVCRHRIGRLCLIPLQGPPTCVLLAWGSITQVSRQNEIFPLRARKRNARNNSGHEVRGLAGRRGCTWSACFLACLSCPTQVWAAPKPWGEAVNIILEAVRLFPEPLPASTPVTSSQAPFWSRPDFEPERYADNFDASGDSGGDVPLLEQPASPVPPHAAELPADVDRRFVQAYCYAMSPKFQAEVIPFQVGIPTDVGAFCESVRHYLRSLRLRFVSDIVPTVPQLDSAFASVVIAPCWIHNAGRQIIVFDLRACGGPVYSDYVWDRVSYGECAAVARRHGIEECAIYAQGHTTRLCQGSSFLAVTGGVVQYQPNGVAAAWCSPLHSRFDHVNNWSADPEIPEEETEWPLFVSHDDRFTLYSAERFPGESASRCIAGFVEREPASALFVTSPGRELEDISVAGLACRDALAVFPITPSPDRTGVLIFVDLRQIGETVKHLYLEQPEVAPAEIIQWFHLRAPIGHKVACWPRPDHTGRVSCAEGDIITFGYVPDSWDGEDECASSSSDESSSAADDDPPPTSAEADTTTQQPSASRGREGSTSVREHSRSRSPRGFTSTLPSADEGRAIHDGDDATESDAGISIRISPPQHSGLTQVWDDLGTSLVLALDHTFPDGVPFLGGRMHKISAEPTEYGGGISGRLAELRNITLELGGNWPYVPLYGLRAPGILQDFEDETPSEPPEICLGACHCPQVALHARAAFCSLESSSYPC